MRSKSGPVRVIRTFEPEPLSHKARHNRALARVSYLQSQIADVEAWKTRAIRRGTEHAQYDTQLINLRKRLTEAQIQEKQIAGEH